MLQDIEGSFDFQDVYDSWVEGVTPPARFVELGVWHGKSAIYLAKMLKTYKPFGVAFYAVDRFDGVLDGVQRMTPDEHWQKFIKNVHDNDCMSHIIPLREASSDAANGFPDKSIRRLMIDASHDFWSVRLDIQAWRPKMEPGGIMVGHDWDQSEVQRAVRAEFGDHVTPVSERCWEVLIG